MNHVELNSGTSKSSKQQNPSVRLKILTYENPMQSYIKKNRVKLWEQIEFNPIQAGGHIVPPPPYRFFLCCAETASSRPMKLSDF